MPSQHGQVLSAVICDTVGSVQPFGLRVYSVSNCAELASILYRAGEEEQGGCGDRAASVASLPQHHHRQFS